MKLDSMKKRFTLKKVKTFRSHDGMELVQGELYFDGINIAFVSEDDWGGGTRFQYHDNYNWKSIEKFTDGCFNEESFEYDIFGDLISNYWMSKDSNKGVLVGEDMRYQIIGFKTTIPTTIKKWKDGLDAYQKIYDKAIKEGKNVLNVAYLKSVGLKIN